MSDTNNIDTLDAEIAAARAAYEAAVASQPSIRPGSAPEPSAHDADAATRAAETARAAETRQAAWETACKGLAALAPLAERMLADQDIEGAARHQMAQSVADLRQRRAAFMPAHLTMHVDNLRQQMDAALARAENVRAERARRRRDETASLRARAEAELNARYRPDLGNYDAASLIAECDALDIRLSVHQDTGALAYVAPHGVEMPSLLRQRLRQIAGAVCRAITPRLV